MKKNIYIIPETTVYETIAETEFLAGSTVPIYDDNEDVFIEDALSKPVTPPNVDLWGDEEE